MAKLIIKNKKVNPSSGYYAKVKYMHGDADGYSTETYGPFPRDGKAFLNFVGMLNSAEDNDSCWGDGDNTPTKNRYWINASWFKDVPSIPTEVSEYINKDLVNKINYRPVSDHCYMDSYAKVDKIDLSFIDDNGESFDVEYELEDEDYLDDEDEEDEDE